MVVRWFLVMSLAAAACGQAPPDAPPFDGARAMEYVHAQLAFGPRIPGTDGHARMAAWLDSMMTARADTVVIQDWEHEARDGTRLPLRNVIGRFNPSATSRLLFLAHWDTRPRADAAGSSDPDAPVPGANDGASGVAVLLAMADALRAAPPSIGVDLLLVDGEDYGFFPDQDVLLGSTYYAANPLPGGKPLFAVLLDMVGDADLQIFQEGYSLTGAPEVVDRVWTVAEDLGLGGVFVRRPGHTLTDDHIPLQQAGFRAIDVIDFDYEPWHTPDDTADKLSAESLEKVGRVMLNVIWRAG